MSHHGNNPPAVQRALHDAMEKLFGEHPDGKLNSADEGAIAFAVGVEAGRVVIRFPKPVAWMGMTGNEALELAQLLIRHARSAGVTSPLIICAGGGPP